MSECTHDIRGQEWVETENSWTGEIEGNWEETYEVTCVDLDLHRWKCTQCGHIGSYGGNY